MKNDFNQKLSAEYQAYMPNLRRFSNELIRQLQFLLNKNNIQLGVPIQTRIKNLKSIIEKHSNKRFIIRKSILELQDLVGIRLILLFKPDIENVITCIKEHFNVMREYNPEDKLEFNQFGYSSKHVIVSPSNDWFKVPTFKDLEQFSAEIQIRTMSQHIWAESSNFFQYKNEQNVPKVLLRNISRISALLETVDLEYERLLEIRERYVQYIETNDDTELNVDTLKLQLDATLPIENKSDNEDYSTLIGELFALKINTITKLKELLLKYLDFVVSVDKKVVASISEDIRLGRFTLDYIVDKERNSRGVYFNHIGLVRNILQEEFGTKWEDTQKTLRELKFKNNTQNQNNV